MNSKPADDQLNSPKPFFVLNGYEPLYKVTVGEAWLLELPPGAHPDGLLVIYRQVVIGEAMRFL